MKSIGGFFEKFNSKITKKVRDLTVIVDVVTKNTAITLDIKDISINNGTLFIKASPLQKNVIYIKKDKILADLNKGLVSLRITDIK